MFWKYAANLEHPLRIAISINLQSNKAMEMGNGNQTTSCVILATNQF